MLTDENGDKILDVDTTPFGDQNDKSPFFTGKQWDEDAELYYFNARWYDPETGRFITEDPVKDGLLWFAYCNNNPLGFVDPTGMINLSFSNKYDMHNTQWGSTNLGNSSDIKINKKGCYLTGFAMAASTLVNNESFMYELMVNPATVNANKDNFVNGSANFDPKGAAENYGLKQDYWTRANNTTDGKNDLAGKINELNKSDTEYSILAHVAWDPANPDTATHWVGISGAAVNKEGEEGFGDGYYVLVTGTSKFDNAESRPDYWVTDAKGNYWIPTEKIPDINTFEKNENNGEEGQE